MPESELAEFTEFLADARIRLARAFVAAYGPDRGEEALAEALGYAWANFDRIAEMTNPIGYLFRVGQSRTRPRKRTVLFPPPGQLGIPDVEPGLVVALGALTERQRVCTLLVHAYDWTLVEVADLLEISASSVQRHIERGIGRLRREIGTIND